MEVVPGTYALILESSSKKSMKIGGLGNLWGKTRILHLYRERTRARGIEGARVTPPQHPPQAILAYRLSSGNYPSY